MYILFDYIETAELYLALAAGYVVVFVEAISILCILAGIIAIIRAYIQTRHLPAQERMTALSFLSLRLHFGKWLALALEFQIAADILGTIIKPSFEELGKLAIIVVLRILLTYFLNRDIETDAKLRERIIEEEPE